MTGSVWVHDELAQLAHVAVFAPGRKGKSSVGHMLQRCLLAASDSTVLCFMITEVAAEWHDVIVYRSALCSRPLPALRTVGPAVRGAAGRHTTTPIPILLYCSRR